MIPQYSEEFALHHAVQSGSVGGVRELLVEKIKVDARDKYGITSLMVAARKDLKEIAQVLLDAGANIDAKDRASRNWVGGRTPLQHACQVGRFQMMRFLVERGADVNCADQNHCSPLSHVLAGDHEEVAKYLLEHGADPNGAEKSSDPPLTAAARRNNLLMIKELLRRGADPNRIGALGNPALTDTTSVECAKELLRNGADVNLKNTQGRTPLIANMIRGSVELLRCYVKAGADVNAADKDGVTVLMSLTDNPRIEVAEMLLKAGANINALPWKNHSVLDFFYGSSAHDQIKERVDLLIFLESKGAKRAKDLRTK